MHLITYTAEKLVDLEPGRCHWAWRLSKHASSATPKVTGPRHGSWLLPVAGMFCQQWRHSTEKGTQWLSIWGCAAICLGQALAVALSSYLRVLCNCSKALDPKPGRNICMFTFIILFWLYGGLSGSVGRRRTEGGKIAIFQNEPVIIHQKKKQNIDFLCAFCAEDFLRDSLHDKDFFFKHNLLKPVL